MSQVVGLPKNSYKPTTVSPIRHGFAPGFANYKKGCTRLAATSDIVYQLLAHGRWFSPGTLASSTTKTGRHDIAEIFLKVGLNTKNLALQQNWQYCTWIFVCVNCESDADNNRYSLNTLILYIHKVTVNMVIWESRMFFWNVDIQIVFRITKS